MDINYIEVLISFKYTYIYLLLCLIFVHFLFMNRINKEINKIIEINYPNSLNLDKDLKPFINQIIDAENLNITFKQLPIYQTEPYLIFNEKSNCSEIYLTKEFYSSTCLSILSPIIHELGHAYLYTQTWYILYLEDIILIEEFLASYIGYKLLLKHDDINLSNSQYKFIKKQLILCYLSYFLNILYWIKSFLFLLKNIIKLIKKRPN